MQSLLEASPDTAGASDPDGNIPLHIALQNGSSADVVELVLKSFPKAASQISTVEVMKRKQAQGYSTLKEAR